MNPPRKPRRPPPAPPPAPGALPALVKGRVREGRMLETNGGGSIEKVIGFNFLRPMTAGFDTTRLSGPTFLPSVPDGGQFSIAPSALAPSTMTGIPYGHGGKPEDVIGIDDRVMIPDTTTTPWRCICHLEITYNTGQVGFGTGWFAGPHAVITAAHCLYSRGKAALEAKQIRVIPGRNGSLAPYGYIIATRFEYPEEWKTEEEDQNAAPHDYGVIYLDDKEKVNDAPFGERIGYFGIRSYDGTEDKHLDLAIVNNAGYPQEATKPYGTMWFNAGRVALDPGVIKDDRFLYYMVDTTGGQSGSPIFMLDAATSQRYVVAIHTTGDFINHGIRITAEVFDQISAWLK